MSEDQLRAELECAKQEVAELLAKLSAAEAQAEKLQSVYKAARGLCFGCDWNNGTHAKRHGYRQQLIDAVDAIEELPSERIRRAAIAQDQPE